MLGAGVRSFLRGIENVPLKASKSLDLLQSERQIRIQDLGLHDLAQSEICHLEVQVLREQEVQGLKVAMDDGSSK